MQPYLGQGPLAMDRRYGNTKDGTDLRDRQAAEKTQLDDLVLPRIEFFQFAERFIHMGDIDLVGFVEFRGEFQRVFPAAFFSAASDGVIRQRLAHGARKNSEEMGAVLPGGVRLVRQS